MKRLALAAALWALVAVPAAGAHLGGPKGFESTVTGYTPAIKGIDAVMLGGDDRMVLHNNTGKVLIIKGYQGEPYLRFSPDAVYQNDRSEAVFLNADRYANVQVPPTASAKAKPQWEKVLPGHAFTWHDHRVHWMSPILPPAVQKDPGARHHVFNWKIPATLDGKPVTIRGTLDYVPPPSSGGPRWWLLAVLLTLAVVGGAAAFFLYRRQPGAKAA
ncbi:MAG: hypothetical protein ACXWYS_04980 [Gaiellaceae bacterium]